jgi:hypothetical protein
VSAAAALLWALRPTLTNAMVRDFLLTTADDQVGNPVEDTPGFDQYHGYGRLNLDRALAASVVAVEPGPIASGFEARIAPNPAGEVATLRYRIPAAGRLEVDLFDLAGRQLADRARHHVPAGDGTIELDTSGLGAGVYLVRIAHRRGDQHNPASVTRRIAVVR